MEGSKLLCRKSSSSSGIIPNFCLGSQPSKIPLILHGLPFGFQPIKAPYIVFHHYFFFYFFLLLFSCSPILFFFFKYGYKGGFGCFNLLLCPTEPTFLGILGIVGFKMSWGLKHTWNLWAALRRPTVSVLWNGGISQAWFTIVARTIV